MAGLFGSNKKGKNSKFEKAALFAAIATMADSAEEERNEEKRRAELNSPMSDSMDKKRKK